MDKGGAKAERGYPGPTRGYSTTNRQSTQTSQQIVQNTLRLSKSFDECVSVKSQLNPVFP